MKIIHYQSLRMVWKPEHNPLIARLLEFNDSPSGVAAFLDELETRGTDVPLLESVPNLAEYGRDLTRYLLFLHEIASSYILVPHIHDEMTEVRIQIEVSIDARYPIVYANVIYALNGCLTHTNDIPMPISQLAHEYVSGIVRDRIAALVRRPPLIVIDDRTAEPTD